MNEEVLEKFVLSSSVPLVQTFSADTSAKIFGSSVKTHMLFFMDTKGAESEALQQVKGGR